MRVFLSHNSADKPAVEELARRLSAAPSGITCWFDKWDLLPGDQWDEEIEKALKECDGCVVFFGPSGPGPWHKEEMHAVIRRRVEDKSYLQKNTRRFRVVPVILPGGERMAESQLPTFLQGTVWVKFQSLDEEDSFERLVCGILARKLNGGIVGVTPGECPYVGLQAFGKQQAPFFFGRSALVQKLIERFRKNLGTPREHKFLALIGASGSGKSSLVAAGLLPAILNQGELPESHQWLCVSCRPGANPWEGLKIAIASNTLLKGCLSAVNDIVNSPEQESRYLHVLARLAFHEQPATRRLLVFVDQFEEFFSLYDKKQDQDGKLAADRQRFIANLLYPATCADSQVIVILTMRADFYGYCAAYDGLRPAVSENQELVGPMNAEELREAIEKPAQRCGCEVELAVVDQLLEDMEQQPLALPFLQHALWELWQRREGRRLTYSAYKEIGGLAGALERRANEAYQRLEKSEQELARKIFLGLVQSGEGTEDTKRRVPLDDLLPLGDALKVQAVIRSLTDARLLVTEGDPGDPAQACVELAHEALIHHWSVLQGWLDNNRECRLWRARLRVALAECKRDPTCVLRGATLEEAKHWLQTRREELTADEAEFIEASERARLKVVADRERLRRRIRVAVSVGVLLLTIFAAETARQWFRAEKQRLAALQERFRAEQQKTNAFAGQLVAEADLLLNDQFANVQHAALLAVQSLREVPSRRADGALRKALTSLPRHIAGLPHSAAVRALAYSRDGKFLIAASGTSAQLWNPATGQPIGSPLDHQGRVAIVACGPDGRHFATVGHTNVRVWETNGKPGAIIEHPHKVDAVLFSPDTQHMATVCRDQSARVWRLANTQQVNWISHTATVTALDFSANGRYLATADDAGNVRVCEALTAREIIRTNQGAAVTAIKFSVDGQSVVAVSSNGLARSWNVADGRETSSIVLKLNGSLGTTIFSRDGKYIAAAGADTRAYVWQASDGKEVCHTGTNQDPVLGLAFSPDGQFFATFIGRNVARLWRTNGTELARMIHDNVVSEVAFSPDGQHIATASHDSNAAIWGVTGYREAVRAETGNPLKRIAFDRDGQRFATAGNGRYARLWESGTGKKVAEFPHAGEVRSVAFSPKGPAYLATACSDGVARVLDIASGREVVHSQHDGEAIDVAFSPDTRFFAAVWGGGDLAVVEISGGTEVFHSNHSKSATSVIFSPDGRRVATASSDQTACVWDLDARRGVLRLAHSGTVNCVCFSPDGRYVATASSDKTLRIWDAASGRQVSGTTNVDWMLAIAFSPDGKHIATGNGISAQVWEWSIWKELTRLQHGGEVESVAFSPDGRYLATAGREGIGRLWLWQRDDLIAEARKRLTRNLMPNEWSTYLGNAAPHRKTFNDLP